jgi:Sigma-70 region 2
LHASEISERFRLAGDYNEEAHQIMERSAMSRSGLGNFLQQVRGVLGSLERRDRPDGELLSAYCSHQDQAAFATLVQRHGPLVLGVCARVLAHAEAKEDAFQATFLALARDRAQVAEHHQPSPLTSRSPSRPAAPTMSISPPVK